MTIIHDPGNTFKVENLWAYCSVDEGGEGIIAFARPDGTMIPLIGADETRVDQYREMAKTLAKRYGKKIVCKKFSTFEVIETFEP